MEHWLLILIVLLLILALFIGVRIMTQVDIIVKAIPFGNLRLVERSRPPVPQHRE